MLLRGHSLCWGGGEASRLWGEQPVVLGEQLPVVGMSLRSGSEGSPWSGGPAPVRRGMQPGLGRGAALGWREKPSKSGMGGNMTGLWEEQPHRWGLCWESQNRSSLG